jgi:hypothetical protein
VHVSPSTKQVKQKRTCERKYNASRKPNSLRVVVIVETENTAPGGIASPGQEIKNGPLLRRLETNRLKSRVGLSPMIAHRRGLSLLEIEPSNQKIRKRGRCRRTGRPVRISPCYCKLRLLRLLSFHDWDGWAGVRAAREGALVASPGFAPPPALAWPASLDIGSRSSFLPQHHIFGYYRRKTDGRNLFFPAPRIPLLSYNMWTVSKFAGFVSPSPRSRFHVALQRAHI